MERLVSAAPEVFERGLWAISPVIPILETQVRPLLVGRYEYVMYYLLGLFCGTGILKILSPGPLKKMFRFYPSWAWTLAALVEFVSSYFFHHGQLDIGIPLYYTFLGAVSFSTISQFSTIHITPFPLSTVALIWCYGKEKGVDSSSWIIPCMATGVFVAILVSGMKSDDGKTKKKTT